MPQVWLVEDDESLRWVLSQGLEQQGFSVRQFESADTAAEALGETLPHVLITDIRMDGMSGLDLLEWASERAPDLPVIVTTAFTDLGNAVSAYRSGAFEYLPKPVDLNVLAQTVERALKRASHPVSEPIDERTLATNAGIIGDAPAMQQVYRAIGRLANSSSSVLISGKSGTGKELVASALHRYSPRSLKPYVALNLANIPGELLESELFGHERGAFTGADEQRKGRFEQADGGTLFLDEIGDMPIDAQTRLLRVLAEGSFYRVGGHALIEVDVRVIAATNQNLEQLVAADSFREDLYYRLSVIRIQMPRLADRLEDIEALAVLFLSRAAEELEEPPRQLSPQTLEQLHRYHWPGNVRQLENLCRWLAVMAPVTEILPQDLPAEFFQSTVAEEALEGGWESALSVWMRIQSESGTERLGEMAQQMLERTLVTTAMSIAGNSRQRAAVLLGWSSAKLARRLSDN